MYSSTSRTAPGCCFLTPATTSCTYFFLSYATVFFSSCVLIARVCLVSDACFPEGGVFYEKVWFMNPYVTCLSPPRSPRIGARGT